MELVQEVVEHQEFSRKDERRDRRAGRVLRQVTNRRLEVPDRLVSHVSERACDEFWEVGDRGDRPVLETISQRVEGIDVSERLSRTGALRNLSDGTTDSSGGNPSAVSS